MSYNYDQNPWDDNYGSQAGGYTQSTGGYNASTGYGASSGYSNPSAQYQDGWGDQSGTQYGAASYIDPQQPEQPPPSDQEANEPPLDASQGYNEPSKPPPSALGRFLRAHVPMCGACMDMTAPLFDLIFRYVNRDLLVSKVFYFFFYSAFGSLFPLMGVYFKQLGMNPSQVGIITGVRPFIEIFSAPFWNSLAERFQKSKVLLLFSILSWIVFTYPLAHIRPPASACVAFNDTDYVLYTPYSANELSNYDVGQLDESSESATITTTPTSANEVFMNKMPNNREGKDEILVNEENVNDQGRRRRRKRSYASGKFREQVDRPALQEARARYAYAVDGPEKGYVSSAPVELDIDLGKDFDDTPLRGEDSPETDEDSFFDLAGASSDYHSDSGQNELEQQLSYGKKIRQRRHLLGEDDILGESEANEPEDEIRPKVAKRRHEDGDEPANDDSENSAAESGGEEESEAQKATKAKHEQHQTEPPPVIASESEREKEEKARLEQEASKPKRVFKQRHKTPPTHIVGMSPIKVEYAVNYNKDKHSQFVTPMFSTIVYKLSDIKEVFFLLLLLVCLGEFFSAPAVTIADSITLSNLGENTDLYGRQRMFGSIGWGITLLLVGMALDNAKTIPGHPCGPHQRERSYTVCFTIFSLLMGCAFFTATQFTLRYSKKGANGTGGQAVVTKTGENNTVVTTIDGTVSTNVDDLYASTRPREIFNTAPPVNAPPAANSREKFEFLDKWKSAVFAQSTGKLPEWVNVFRQFGRTMHLTYLFITWFLGCGVGLVFTFLFWHLQEVGPGGTPTLFGICSVINHISEILAYFFSSFFIKRYGHTKVLSVGLGCNVIRFLYVAFLSNPYYALPFELVQGITHAACFAACCSYMSHVSKPELKASTQGVMQGLHNGIGRACGAIIGGYMINAIGSRASFCIYGLLSGCVLGGLLYIRKKVSLEEAEVKVDDNENLGDFGAPQGVPTTIPNKMAQSAPQQDIDYQW